MAGRDKDRTEQLRVAALNGLFVVLGGLVAFAGAFYLEGRRSDRGARQEAAQTRGAARILYVELQEAAAQQGVLANDRKLRRFDSSYRIEMRPEDLRLVASKVTAGQWGSVSDAIVNTQGLASYVNTLIGRDGRQRLKPGEACYALRDAYTVRLAAEAVATVADPAGKPQPPDEPTCIPTPPPGP